MSAACPRGTRSGGRRRRGRRGVHRVLGELRRPVVGQHHLDLIQPELAGPLSHVEAEPRRDVDPRRPGPAAPRRGPSPRRTGRSPCPRRRPARRAPARGRRAAGSSRAAQTSRLSKGQRSTKPCTSRSSARKLSLMPSGTGVRSAWRGPARRRGEGEAEGERARGHGPMVAPPARDPDWTGGRLPEPPLYMAGDVVLAEAAADPRQVFGGCSARPRRPSARRRRETRCCRRSRRSRRLARALASDAPSRRMALSLHPWRRPGDEGARSTSRGGRPRRRARRCR